MELEYDYWTGRIKEVKESLDRSIGQYRRHYRKIKIGVTNDPERRKREHQRSTEGWDYMVVKYGSSSVNNVYELEKHLVDYFWEYNTNEIGGGGGPAGEGTQYLYVLLKE